MKSSDAAVEAWNGHGLPERARARREEVKRINRDLNERERHPVPEASRLSVSVARTPT